MDSGAQASNQLLGSYMTLRKAIGWIGICLPFAVFLGNWVIFSQHSLGCLAPISDKLPGSLSGYYYSHMRDAFVGAMWAAGVFLFFYRGRDWIDRWATNLAGLFALGIALFPTRGPARVPSNSCSPVTPLVAQPAPNAAAISIVHVVSLCGLMLMIAVMAARFTRTYSDDEIGAMTDEEKEIEQNPSLKRRNNRIYWGCVAGIVVAGAFALAQNFFSVSVKANAPWLLYAETIAFLAFGTAWFVKGRALLGLGNARRTVGHALVTARARRLVSHPVSSPVAVAGSASPGPGFGSGPDDPDGEL
ncbi:MAG TPA: hypothetical protein VEV45_20305 [Streptosporangiaceae bacterium]|nr:hypothetical protein [Streptosporangiaceae bacterium]